MKCKVVLIFFATVSRISKNTFIIGKIPDVILKSILFRKAAITTLTNFLVSYLKEPCEDVEFKN